MSHRRVPFERSRSLSPNNMRSEEFIPMKKPKLAEATGGGLEPSAVLHLRNLPSDAVENEILMLGMPFGKVRNLLVIKKTHQAFMEMFELGHAISMVQYYDENPPSIRKNTVYIQYSKHKELKKQTNSGVNFSSLEEPFHRGGPSTDSQNLEMCDSETNKILRVIVEDMHYPVTIDVLHQVFSKYGAILKILTFTKNEKFHALIEFGMVPHAMEAKSALNGLNIYTGCCTLRIDYSNLPSVIITHNSDKARDFTKGDVYKTDNFEQGTLAVGPYRDRLFDRPPRLVERRGNDRRGGRFSEAGIFDHVPNNPSRRMDRDYDTPVILVSNLNQERITPHTLFMLFGAYGDVLRVKIIFTKKNTALVQMADVQQAHTAMFHLQNVQLFGKPMRLSSSKFSYVEIKGNNEAGLTEDYTQSKLHRFSKPGSKNFHNIFPPSSTLHLSNLGPDCTEEKIKEIFTERNFNVKAFEFFQKNKTMALIQLQSMEEGIEALINLHDFELDQSHHLRVSFTKNSLID